MAKGGRRNHSGRHRVPTEMKVVQGTFRGDRHDSEVQIAAKWPEPPAHLSDRERELWVRLEAECAPWVAVSDWPAINGVVALMDRILRIQESQRATEDGGKPLAFKVTFDSDGNQGLEPKENPLFTMELKFWTALRGYIAIVGLSPVDRARVAKPSEGEKPANPLDRFINKAR